MLSAKQRLAGQISAAKCGSLTVREQMAIIKKWLAMGSWSDSHVEVFASALTMTVFWTVYLLRV